jgi:hypothetical protein
MVLRWAADVGLPQEVLARLREHDINGMVFESLSEADLSTMGVTKFGWRRQLILERQELLKGQRPGSAAAPKAPLRPRALSEPPEPPVSAMDRALAREGQALGSTGRACAGGKVHSGRPCLGVSLAGCAAETGSSPSPVASSVSCTAPASRPGVHCVVRWASGFATPPYSGQVAVPPILPPGSRLPTKVTQQPWAAGSATR